MTNNFFIPTEWESRLIRAKKANQVFYMVAYIKNDCADYFEDGKILDTVMSHRKEKILKEIQPGNCFESVEVKFGDCKGEELIPHLEKVLTELNFDQKYFSNQIQIRMRILRSSRSKCFILKPGEDEPIEDRLFAEMTKKMKTETLLTIGKRIASTDYAVCNFHKKGHPKFHKNRATLEKAIRRAYAIGAFNHRSQAKEILEETETELIRQEQKRIAEES